MRLYRVTWQFKVGGPRYSTYAVTDESAEVVKHLYRAKVGIHVHPEGSLVVETIPFDGPTEVKEDVRQYSVQMPRRT